MLLIFFVQNSYKGYSFAHYYFFVLLTTHLSIRSSQFPRSWPNSCLFGLLWFPYWFIWTGAVSVCVRGMQQVQQCNQRMHTYSLAYTTPCI